MLGNLKPGDVFVFDGNRFNKVGNALPQQAEGEIVDGEYRVLNRQPSTLEQLKDTARLGLAIAHSIARNLAREALNAVMPQLQTAYA